ncbi:ATP-binding protein [Pseudoalteromonas luteoviolacea]|uniref:ATP-binding protein n=1 Tax=Pseudoalteromonas luteoviolacea TaxID=43657 RepID=UPI0011AB538E|nr:ATP-binding protein [Pseudoalteromonas luteoviolacea]
MFNISQSQVRDVSVTCQVYHFIPRSIEPKYQQRVENFLFEYLGDERTHLVFGGREAQFKSLDLWLNQPSSDRLFLGAPAGRGKSALLANWTRSLTDFKVLFLPISVRFDTCREDVFLQMFAGALADALAQDFEDSPVGDTANYYRNIIERLFVQHQNQQLLIVIDGLDEAKGWTLKSLIPARLSAGLKFLVSARLGTADRDINGWLRALNWHQHKDCCQVMTLPAFDKTNIMELLSEVARQKEAYLPLSNFEHLFADDALVEQIYRLSSGEPLLIKYYVEYMIEQAQCGKRVDNESLGQLAPGYNGYFCQWFAEQEELTCGSNAFNQDSVLAFLALLAHAYGPIQAHDMKQLLETMLPDTPINLPTLSNALSRFVIGHGNLEGYALSHPALAQFLVSGEAEFLCTSTIERAAQSYINWGELQLQQFEKNPDFEPAEYLIRHYCTHLIECNANPQKLIMLLGKPWYEACFNFYGSHKAYADDIRSISEVLAKTDDAESDGLPNYFAAQLNCTMILSSIHSLNTVFSPKLCGLGLRHGLFSQNQVFELIRQFPDDEDAISALQAAAPFFNEQGLVLAMSFWLSKSRNYWQDIPVALLRCIATDRLIQLIEANEIDTDSSVIQVLAERVAPQQYDELVDFICRCSNRGSLFYELVLSAEFLEKPARAKAIALFVDMFTEHDLATGRKYRNHDCSIDNWNKNEVISESQVMSFVTQHQANMIWQFCENDPYLFSFKLFEHIRPYLSGAECNAIAQRQVDKLRERISHLNGDNTTFEALDDLLSEVGRWCTDVSVQQQKLLLFDWLQSVSTLIENTELTIEDVCQDFSEQLSEAICQSFPEQVEVTLTHVIGRLDQQMSELCSEFVGSDEQPVFKCLDELRPLLANPKVQNLGTKEAEYLENSEHLCRIFGSLLYFLPSKNKSRWISQLFERLAVLRLFEAFDTYYVLNKAVKSACQLTASSLLSYVWDYLPEKEDNYLFELIPKLDQQLRYEVYEWALKKEKPQSRTLFSLMPYLDDQLLDAVVEYALSRGEHTDIQLLVVLARAQPESKSDSILQQIITYSHILDDGYFFEEDLEFLKGKWPDSFYKSLFDQLTQFKNKKAVGQILSVLLPDMPVCAIPALFTVLPTVKDDEQIKLLKQIMPRVTLLDIACAWQYLIDLKRLKHDAKKVVDPEHKNCFELLASIASAIVSTAEPGDYLIARVIEVLVPYLPRHLVNEVMFHIAQLNDPKYRKEVIDNIAEHLDKDQIVAVHNQILSIADADKLMGYVYRLEGEHGEQDDVLTTDILDGLLNDKKRFNLLALWLPYADSDKKAFLLKQAIDILLGQVREESFDKYVNKIIKHCDTEQQMKIFSFVCSMVNNVEKGQALECMAAHLQSRLMMPVLEQCLNIRDGYLRLGILRAASPNLQRQHLDKVRQIVDSLDENYRVRAEVALIRFYQQFEGSNLSFEILDSILNIKESAYIAQCLRECATVLSYPQVVSVFQHYSALLEKHENRVYEIEKLIELKSLFPDLHDKLTVLIAQKIDALEINSFYSLLDSKRDESLDNMSPEALRKLTHYVLDEERLREMLHMFIWGDERLRMVFKDPLMRQLKGTKLNCRELRELLPLLPEVDKKVILQTWLDELSEGERSESLGEITQLLLDNKLNDYYQPAREMMIDVHQRWP